MGHKKSIVFLSFTLLVLTALFWSFPRIDIQVSEHFFNSENVHRFPLMYDPTLRFIQKSVDWFAYILAIGLSLLLIWHYGFKRSVAWLGLSGKQLRFLLLALAIGPGIMVQLATKEVFERPRPIHTKEFTGEFPFVPPMIVGEDKGKSFVSGHASMGFYFAAFALLFASGKRRIGLYVFAIALGLTFGSFRIIQGRHFLSDILFSGVITLLSIHISYLWIYSRFSLISIVNLSWLPTPETIKEALGWNNQAP